MKMKNKTNMIALVLVLSLVLAIVYFYIKYNKTKISVPISGKPEEAATGNYTDTINESMILKQGMSGQNIKLFQEQINLKAAAAGSQIRIVSDGVYGNATETAVQQLSQGFLSSAKNNVSIAAVKALPIQVNYYS